MIHPAPSSWRWQVHERMASTQDGAIAAARAGDAGRLAVLANVQSSGRGSRGRNWVAPAGNLNLSVLLRPCDALPDPGYWAMLAGVALHDALSPFTDGLMLKWPNDVLLRGAKLGGVLIESSLCADGALDWVVIGFGANLAVAPRVAGRATACLPEPVPAAKVVASAVLANLDALETAELHAAWLQRAHPPGTELDVVTPHRRVQGRFAGLTARGELLLQGCLDPIGSADVFAPALETGFGAVCASAQPHPRCCSS